MNELRVEPPSLDTIHDLEDCVWKATVLKAALELDLFTTIAEGHHTLKDIVAATQCSERGMRILLDALCPLGLLSKSGGEYALTPTSVAYFVPGEPTYYGDWCLRIELAWEARGRIAEGIRTGRAVGIDATKPDSDDLWASDYATALLNWPQRAEKAWEIWETLDVNKETLPGLRILDVACGPGVKSFILAQADADARITALDLPKVLERVTTKVAEAMDVKEQVTFRSDDVLTADFGAEQFDIVLFGMILYFFNPDQVRNILQRAYQALKPGGLVVINSGIADEERCQNEYALMVAFQLFIFCPESEVYTFSEYKELLEQAGFSRVIRHSDTLISATK
jgi:2-polyprenyl-3-methyl-5-hydroxy-6-metoxy-1,4-benzoquinol methylase